MNKKFNTLTKNRDGFTVVEVIIAGALIGGFMLLAAGTLKDLYQLTKTDTKRVDSQTDLTFAMRYMSGLIKNSTPSFNNIVGVKDNNGLEFFDHVPDMSTVSWPANQRTRTLTLSEASGRFELPFLVQSEKQLNQITYNPLDAYEIPDPVEEMNASAILNYSGVNKNNVISKMNPKVWEDGNYLLFRVPIPLRYVAVDSTVNMMQPPREHVFLGKVVKISNDVVVEKFLGKMRTTHPVDNSQVLSPDRFLRTVPSVGGSSPFIDVTLVDGYKFALEKDPKTNFYRLFSYIYKDGAFTRPFLIAEKVKAVTFSRENLSLQLVNIRITLDTIK